MARACSADGGWWFVEDFPIRPTFLKLNGKQIIRGWVGGCRKERYVGNGNFLGGCDEGGSE